jgi:hypothetical protein
VFLFFLLFLALSALIVGDMMLSRSYIKYKSDMQRITPAIRTPKPEGLITTSYTRSNDILAAVEESLRHIHDPVRSVFAAFCSNLKYVDANAPAQIERMKGAEGRVASPRLGQLTRGLVSVLRGDDQRMYFDMLASEYRKSQNEEVSKALLKRPEQLTKYIALLFVCMVLMIIASLGVYLVQQMGALF